MVPENGADPDYDPELYQLGFSICSCLLSVFQYRHGQYSFTKSGSDLKPIKFLDSDSHTYIAMLLWSTWKGLGWGAIMYLASIAGIDQEMYEGSPCRRCGKISTDALYHTSGADAYLLCYADAFCCKLLK